MTFVRNDRIDEPARTAGSPPVTAIVAPDTQFASLEARATWPASARAAARLRGPADRI
jgi:hypothetical protein